jgi:nitrite reductase/ring-hydroxylating ferredoxin subunit/uncharacterized membrane protein
MLKSLLQGKPFGHPLHPAIVHFPIGLLVLSLLIDLAARFWSPSSVLVQAAFASMSLGLLGGLAAALAGLADWSDIRRDHPAKKTATTHMLLNVSAMLLVTLNLALRFGRIEQESPELLHLLLSAAAVGLIFISGYLGGTLVYDDGIGAGRHRRRTPTPEDTIQVSAKNAQDGWLTVAPAGSLEHGETLRVDFGGTVMTILKLGEQVYAFQEFCTHRYGPLSEGAVYDHQVECPWHRSCFDVRTGKVTEGPAKVDLKTFPVEIREGDIALRVESS